MKKLITLFTFIILTLVSNAQINKFTTIAVAFKETDQWTDWQEYNTEIISDTDKMYIDIDNIRFYISSEKKPMVFSENNKNILIFFCLDQDGIKCVIEFVRYIDTYHKQIYIRYSEKEIVYQIKL